MKYKITIQEITEKEVPEKEYKVIGQKDNGEDKYGYVETGQIRIERAAKDVFIQEIEDLDLGELATYINREE